MKFHELSNFEIHFIFSAGFAIFMLNVDEIMSEFRECFQKMENTMEICRIGCQILQNSLKCLKPTKLFMIQFIIQFICSIHSLRRPWEIPAPAEDGRSRLEDE